MIKSFLSQTCVVIILSCFFIPGLGMSGARIETAHLIFEDVDQQLSAEQLQRFSSDSVFLRKHALETFCHSPCVALIRIPGC